MYQLCVWRFCRKFWLFMIKYINERFAFQFSPQLNLSVPLSRLEQVASQTTHQSSDTGKFVKTFHHIILKVRHCPVKFDLEST